MNEETQREYDRLLTKLVLRHGELVRHDPSIYMWRDHAETFPNDWYGRDFVEHLARCSVQSVSEVKEDTWYEFAGTFEENDRSVHGIVVKGLTCACGKLTDREIRWVARMQEVAKAVFEEHLEEHRSERS